MKATKAARNLAEELGLSLEDVEGTGASGAVKISDVRDAAGVLTGGMPPEFRGRAKRIWEDVEGHLTAKGLWDSVYAELLKRYIDCLLRAAEAREIEKEEGGTTEGSQGQIVVHPKVKVARDNEHDALDLAKELLITPAAQRRHEKEAHPAENDGIEDDPNVLGF